MTNYGHTPGPWTYNLYKPGSKYQNPAVTDKAHNGIVMEVWGQGKECAEANARLIAAAPDLLAACEAALIRIKEYEIVNDYHHPLVRQLERAIDMAKGPIKDVATLKDLGYVVRDLEKQV